MTTVTSSEAWDAIAKLESDGVVLWVRPPPTLVASRFISMSEQHRALILANLPALIRPRGRKTIWCRLVAYQDEFSSIVRS